MRIFLICSKQFYGRIPPIRAELERAGHLIALPNCYDDPGTEDRVRALGSGAHSRWKAQMIRHSEDVIRNSDAVLVLNFEKDGLSNYVGGATFLEMYDAFRLGKKLFLYNDMPEGIFRDELSAFSPTITHGDLSKVT